MVRFILLFICISTATAQREQAVDFLSLNAKLEVDMTLRSVSGRVEYKFEVNKIVDTIYIDAARMRFSDVSINGNRVGFVASATQLKLYDGFKRGNNNLVVTYEARPKQTMYFTGSGSGMQVWTQGQGKNTSHWLPSFNDPTEKLVFNLTFIQSDVYEVVANGVLKNKRSIGNRVEWEYRMTKPMSSYLAMVAIGKFDKMSETAASGVPLEMYFRPEDASKAEPTYRFSKKMFDFLEKEIGIPYPWEIYKQVPVLNFLYAGMENTSATIFAQDFVVDNIGFNDRNYVNVNAHELAHQWFGDMVTAESGKHHWLQEGFATYYALLAEREIFGDDYFNWKLYEMAGMLQQASKSDTVPILNEKASALTFYQKGAWALHVLRESVGEDNFRKAVKSYLAKHAFKSVMTDDFLVEINKVSSFDTKSFTKRWLENPKFEIAEALSILKKSTMINQYFKIQELSVKAYTEKSQELLDIINSDAYYPIKVEAVRQTQDVPFSEKLHFIRTALSTQDLHVRRAVAQSLTKIPEAFFDEYALLLSDASYLTREIAMANLWEQFPEKRAIVLDRTDGQLGLNDMNLRIQWLALALATKDYRNSEKAKFYDELIRYAKPEFESSIRQNALESLLFLDKNDTNVLPLLVNPMLHHKWQFSKFAREKVRELLKKPNHLEFYKKLVGEISGDEKTALQRLIDELK